MSKLARVLLSIHDGHNAAAALVIDGAVRSALQEERPTRQKNRSGFPHSAIERLLRDSGIEGRDLDGVAFNGFHVATGPPAREEQIIAYKKSAAMSGQFRRFARNTPVYQWRIQSRRRQRVRAAQALGVPAAKVKFFDHHLCHAATAYYGSGRREGRLLVLTADGAGDGLCATASIGESGALTRFAEVPEANSLGILWALVTAMLGMVPLEHEYKLMGLAPYAPPSGAEKVRAALSSCFLWEGEGSVSWTRAQGIPPIAYSYKYFRGLLEFCRFDWICAGLQAFTEELVCEWVRRCIRRTGIHDVALSGGLFMNVKLNKRIMEMPEVESLYVAPSCGDETNVFGLAFLALCNGGAWPGAPPLQSLFLGPAPNDSELSAAVTGAVSTGAVTATRPEDLNREVAGLLASGEIVARFSDREEFGARALGNRSILADAARPSVVREINSIIKCRDFWMPFACTILAEDERHYLKNPKGIRAPFMILTFDTTDAAHEIQAGCHPQDKTCRPQVLERDANPAYYGLIAEFKGLTGRGALLNTSLNLHGSPIVSSPKDAIDLLLGSGLSNMALGPWLLRKRSAKGSGH